MKKNTAALAVFQAFEKVGFVYLNNYHELIGKAKDILKLAHTFFSQPEKEKLKVVRGKDPNDFPGYIPFAQEGLSNDDIDPPAERNLKVNASSPSSDLKELYQLYNPNMIQPYKNKWPEIPMFREKMEEFYEACHVANLHIMSCIAIGLGLNVHYFDKFLDQKANALRLLHYPSVLKIDGAKRAGAHTDYGSIAFLFQDDCGGLQVRNAAGEFVDALPIPGTIIVNAADMLQRWCNNRLKSALHRVVAPSHPPDTNGNLPERYSVVYFCTPNMDVSIECLPGCEGENGPKYPPIISGEYLMRRITGGHY